MVGSAAQHVALDRDGRNKLLLDDAEIGRDDGAAIIAAKGQCQAQRLDQHAQPERRGGYCRSKTRMPRACRRSTAAIARGVSTLLPVTRVPSTSETTSEIFVIGARSRRAPEPRC